MKKSMVGFCLMACAAFAQETNVPCFVVADSSGTVPAGTVLYPEKIPCEKPPFHIFTNHPYRMAHNIWMDKKTGMQISVDERGVAQTNWSRIGLIINKFFDGTRVYTPRNPTNEVYVCTNDFVRLVRTNIVIRPRTAE